MSKIEVNKIGPQCGTTLTVGCGAGQTVAVDANTVTLGRCGGTVALASGATQSGFGRTGTVDWQTGDIKTATFTAANGEGYFANTSGSAFTMNLPAATAGNIVSVVDYTNTFQTNNLTISPNGSQKIGGVSSNYIANTEGLSLTFVYVDDTEGWKNVQDATSNAAGESFITATGGTITTSGNFKIHTFTGPGTFTVCSVGTAPGTGNAVDYMVVAGGGAGAGKNNGGGVGGGGAGGIRIGTICQPSPLSPASLIAPGHTVTAQSYPIVVGAGGGCSTNNPDGTAGSSGSNSSFSSFTSAGGGGGNDAADNGTSGGSGGGGGEAGGTAGAGNTPPVSPSQGNPGGNGNSPSVGAGGGGFTAAGCNSTPAPASPTGNGGAGINAGPIFGTVNGSPGGNFGGGGGASVGDPAAGPFSGGTGGGGQGNAHDQASTSGGTNTGGGGGAHGSTGAPNGGTNGGGSGIVIIRYKFQ